MYRCRIDDHLDHRCAPPERGEHVAQRRRSGRCNDANGARKGRQRAFNMRIEQAFVRQLFLQLQERLEQGAGAGTHQSIHVELVITTRFEQRQRGAHFHRIAIARLPVESPGAVFPHGAAHLGACVLEHEVQMPGSCPRQVRQLTTHGRQRVAALEQGTNAAIEFGHAQGARAPCSALPGVRSTQHGGRCRAAFLSKAEKSLVR